MTRKAKLLVLFLAFASERSPTASAFRLCSVQQTQRRRRTLTVRQNNASAHQTDTLAEEKDDDGTALDLEILEKPIQKLKEIDFRNGRIFVDMVNNNSKEKKNGKLIPKTEQIFQEFDLGAYANNFVKLFQGEAEKEEALSDIIAKARDSFTQSDVSDKRSFGELLSTFETYASLIGKVNDRYLSTIDWSLFDPTSLFYYLEYEDEVKNPSWKRRRHRYMEGVDMERVLELNEYASLAKISYADSLEELQQKLTQHTTPCEVVAAELVSEPGKPASYLAVPVDQPSGNDTLQVVLGVRGTKTIADAITDFLCTDEDYRGGKAHSYMLRSGKYLVKRYTLLLEELLELSEKSKLKIKLVGHSMGAGAAAIAGIELNDNPQMEVQVFGFGSPAMLSEELAVGADFITTIVNDQDVVPRLSGVTVANLMRDMLEFDWFPYADRDAHEAIEAFHARHSNLLGKDVLLQVKAVFSSYLEEYVGRKIQSKTAERHAPNLFPPGQCIHFYRDGVTFSANVVPNSFFSDIDVTRRMLDDHLFVSGYQQTFLAVMRAHHGDPHFSFEEAMVEGETN